MKIPYKPLSSRMLQEPFWLGLITVFVVLAVIGLVWCAKRHFPEKIEKLLAEEADRNRRKYFLVRNFCVLFSLYFLNNLRRNTFCPSILLSIYLFSFIK